MKSVLDKIQIDYESRFLSLKNSLDKDKDWKTLQRVLNLHRDDCFKIFRMPNDSLEDVGTLYSMLVNCLLDDSSFMVDVDGEGIFTALFITWGNDGEKRVSENDLNHIIDLIQIKREFLDANKEQLDSFDDLELTRSYFALDDKINIALRDLASNRIQKKFDHRSQIKI